eukprot:352193-Chlamydomonas_euryale.AAC.29
MHSSQAWPRCQDLENDDLGARVSRCSGAGASRPCGQGHADSPGQPGGHQAMGQRGVCRECGPASDAGAGTGGVACGGGANEWQASHRQRMTWRSAPQPPVKLAVSGRMLPPTQTCTYLDARALELRVCTAIDAFDLGTADHKRPSAAAAASRQRARDVAQRLCVSSSAKPSNCEQPRPILPTPLTNSL